MQPPRLIIEAELQCSGGTQLIARRPLGLHSDCSTVASLQKQVADDWNIPFIDSVSLAFRGFPLVADSAVKVLRDGDVVQFRSVPSPMVAQHIWKKIQAAQNVSLTVPTAIANGSGKDATGSKRKRSEDEAGEVQEPLKSSEEDESEESDDDSDEDEDDSEEDEDEEEHDRTKLARQKPSDTVKGKGVKSRRKGNRVNPDGTTCSRNAYRKRMRRKLVSQGILPRKPKKRRVQDTLPPPPSQTNIQLPKRGGEPDPAHAKFLETGHIYFDEQDEEPQETTHIVTNGMNGVADHEEDSGTTSDEDDEVDDDISHDPRPNGVLNGTADSGVSSDAMQHEQHNQDRTDEYRSQDKINGPGVSNLPIMNGQNYARASEPDDEEEAAGHHAQDVRDKAPGSLSGQGFGESVLTNLPVFSGTPTVGQQIAYRVLEIGSDYCPKESEWREGTVSDFDIPSSAITIQPSQQMRDYHLQLQKDRESDMIEDTDNMICSEYDKDGVLTTLYSNLTQVRLLNGIITPSTEAMDGEREEHLANGDLENDSNAKSQDESLQDVQMTVPAEVDIQTVASQQELPHVGPTIPKIVSIRRGNSNRSQSLGPPTSTSKPGVSSISNSLQTQNATVHTNQNGFSSKSSSHLPPPPRQSEAKKPRHKQPHKEKMASNDSTKEDPNLNTKEDPNLTSKGLRSPSFQVQNKNELSVPSVLSPEIAKLLAARRSELEDSQGTNLAAEITEKIQTPASETKSKASPEINTSTEANTVGPLKERHRRKGASLGLFLSKMREIGGLDDSRVSADQNDNI